MVYRIFVEKKPGLDNEARAIKNDITELLQIKGVEKVRLFNRYDVEDLAEDLFNYSVNTVFAEPQLDIVTKELPEADCIFAVEPLPGQFDQRASSAAECIQIISKGERPTVKTAKVYALYGKVSEEEVAAIKKYVINAVESREAAMELPETLAVHYEIPTTVETVEGFIDLTEEELAQFIKDRGLAMDLADI
ncbi:MAG: phosphoribosylformylglycinamidine synthase, partial [Firmicutes bacterium]|nr:phosphoribosylformylglycinamidine synthase [Bacillota bacterium]